MLIEWNNLRVCLSLKDRGIVELEQEHILFETHVLGNLYNELLLVLCWIPSLRCITYTCNSSLCVFDFFSIMIIY